MARIIFTLSSLALVLSAHVAMAQNWAESLFNERSVNFGAVPRAAKVEHEFLITNTTGEDLHISSVRSSCGCTQPRIENNALKPGETGKIIAAFNTQSFTGQRGATVTVTFDQPRWAEVQLRVKGYIRTDVVLSPNYVNFGSVAEGEASQQKVQINYAGRSDWEITGVQSNSPYVTANVVETQRNGGRIAYELDVQLAEDAPQGYLNDQLTLFTNDHRATQFPVVVEGRIVPELSVSPATLLLGSLQPGQEIKKQIVIRGDEPFTITDIRCDEQAFQFAKPEGAKSVHLVPVTFTVPNKPGKLTCTIEIVTDKGNGKVAKLPVTCEIGAPLAGK